MQIEQGFTGMALRQGCVLCPRRCQAQREAGRRGFCGETDQVRIGRAALHAWEEPCISGETGSGTVFFTGCTLRCVYCQNYKLLQSGGGRQVDISALAAIFLDLQNQGAANVNLVTPDHFLPQILSAIELAKVKGLALPLVFNLSGYETVEMIRMLEGAADIYLTDYKYEDAALAEQYSRAADYPLVAKAALAEMVRQQPAAEFDGQGMMKKGVIVRHLLLPGHVRASKEAIRYLYKTYGNRIYLSIMNQYTPRPGIEETCPQLARRVTKREYERLVDYALSLGVENAFIQEGDTAQESFVPEFK